MPGRQHEFNMYFVELLGICFFPFLFGRANLQPAKLGLFDVTVMMVRQGS
jgi:hypothetical protein